MPSTVTTPLVGGMTPASTRIVVDLPAPLRPSRAVAVPAGHREPDSAHRVHRSEPDPERAYVDEGGCHGRVIVPVQTHGALR